MTRTITATNLGYLSDDPCSSKKSAEVMINRKRCSKNNNKITYHGYEKCGRQTWHVCGCRLWAHGVATSQSFDRSWECDAHASINWRKESLSDHDHLFWWTPRKIWSGNEIQWAAVFFFMALAFNEERIISKTKEIGSSCLNESLLTCNFFWCLVRHDWLITPPCV